MCGLDRHMRNVSVISRKIGKEMRMNDMEVTFLSVAAYLHDIGKYKLDQNILYKKEKLSEFEISIIMQHSEIGAKLLSQKKYPKEIVNAILYHHEKFDGSGYPYQLKGNKIPIFARIISVADAFDAMTSDRCYKEAYDTEIAFNEIIRCADKQFDPYIVENFKKVYLKSDKLLKV